jgi:hypothetical protein
LGGNTKTHIKSLHKFPEERQEVRRFPFRLMAIPRDLRDPHTTSNFGPKKWPHFRPPHLTVLEKSQNSAKNFLPFSTPNDLPSLLLRPTALYLMAKKKSLRKSPKIHLNFMLKRQRLMCFLIKKGLSFANDFFGNFLEKKNLRQQN